VNCLPDQQLLRDYALHRSEAAFSELVRRRVDFVYSAALRMVHDAHLAEDVTQGVFMALARSARQLTDCPALSAWLFRTAQNLAANAVRSDLRRRAREHEAAAMNELFATESEAVWERIAPHLDVALGELSAADREALLLRYFEHKSAREIAQTLGTSEDAAQKRVNRAVERLRKLFAERGVTISESGLIVVISANAVLAAPCGLAVTISTEAALAGTAVAIPATVTAAEAITMTTLQKTFIAAIVVAGAATPLMVQHQSQIKLREENQSLRQRVEELSGLVAKAENSRASSIPNSVAPELPAQQIHDASPSAESSPQDLQSNDVRAGILGGYPHPPDVTGEQVEAYLQENQRSAASLLASSRVTRNQRLLQEAMEKYPEDPQVDFAAVFKKDASPEERREWLDAFKQSAPDNALANYLSAREFFKSGQVAQAVQELDAAASKQQFQDYFLEFSQSEEEAWSAAGYSVAEAKVYSAWSLLYPHLAELKELGRDMVSLASSYRQAGDASSAQVALQMAVNLGQRFDGSPAQPLPSREVRLEIESMALQAMNPASPYGTAGQTVKDRLNELAQQHAVVTELERQGDAPEWLQSVPERDWITYKDRWRAFGEEAALRWLVGKYSQR